MAGGVGRDSEWRQDGGEQGMTQHNSGQRGMWAKTWSSGGGAGRGRTQSGGRRGRERGWTQSGGKGEGPDTGLCLHPQTDILLVIYIKEG